MKQSGWGWVLAYVVDLGMIRLKKLCNLILGRLTNRTEHENQTLRNFTEGNCLEVRSINQNNCAEASLDFLKNRATQSPVDQETTKISL